MHRINIESKRHQHSLRKQNYSFCDRPRSFLCTCVCVLLASPRVDCRKRVDAFGWKFWVDGPWVEEDVFNLWDCFRSQHDERKLGTCMQPNSMFVCHPAAVYNRSSEQTYSGVGYRFQHRPYRNLCYRQFWSATHCVFLNPVLKLFSSIRLFTEHRSVLQAHDADVGPHMIKRVKLWIW